MTMKRRTRFAVFALAGGLVVSGVVLAIVYRHGARDEVPTGGGAWLSNLPADSRPLPSGAVARLGFARDKDVLFSRREIITAAYSADGKLIVGADWTGAANMKGYQLWDAQTGALVREVPTPIRALFGVSLSRDGTKLAWGGNEGVAVAGVSDVTTGGVLMRTGGGNRVAFTPDGKHVVIGGYGSVTVVADAATGKIVQTLAEPGRFANTFVLSRDGTTVVTSAEKTRTANYDHNEAGVEVWDVATGKLKKVLASNDWPLGLKALAVSSDGKLVAFNRNKQLSLVDAETGAARWQIENPGKNHVWEFVAFSPNGDELFAIRTNYDDHSTTTLDLLDANTGLTLRTFDGLAYQFHHAAFSPDGKRVITFGEGMPFRIWDTATGRLLPAYEGHRAAPQCLAISEDGRTIVSADELYSVCVWGESGLRKRFDLRGVRSLDLSANGRTAIVTGPESSTLLFDLTTNTRRVLTRYQTQYSAISRDGTRAAVSKFGDLIEIIELASGKVLQSLVGQSGDLYALAFSTDGRRVLTAARTRDTGRFVGEFEGNAQQVPADAIRVWDAATGKEVRKWDIAAKSAALSADGRVMIAGCKDGTVRRMDVESGKELEPLKFHAGSVGAVAVSADGTSAASAGGDEIVLWDPFTGRERKRYKHDHTGLTALAFSGNGRRLVSTGIDGTILVWE